MQSSYRSSGGGFRPPFGFRNRGRGGFGFSFGRGRWGFGRARGGYARGRTRPYSPPPAVLPPSGDYIFMQAGRLAAEYLVSKGLLPPNTLSPNRELRGPPLRGRINYIGRGGRGRGRYGPYGRGFDYDGGRGPWADRDRRCHETMEEGEIGEFDEVGSSESGVGVRSDERDSGIELYDTGSKPSSSSVRMDSLVLTSTRVDLLAVVEDDMNGCNAVGEDPLAVTEVTADGDAKLLNLESGDGKNGLSDNPKKRKRQSMEDVGIDVQPCRNEFDNRLELGSFAEVSKKLRSSGVQISLNDDATNTLPVTEMGASVVVEVEALKGRDTSKYQEPNCSSAMEDQLMEETVEPLHESVDPPTGFGISVELVDGGDDDDLVRHVDELDGVDSKSVDPLTGFGILGGPVDGGDDDSLVRHVNELDGVNSKSVDPPMGFGISGEPVDGGDDDSLVRHVDELDGIDSLRVVSSPSLRDMGTCIGGLSTEEKTVEVSDQEKQVGAFEGFLKAEPEFGVKMDEDKGLLATSLDLNLMGSSETSKVPEDPVLDCLQTPPNTLETGKEVRVGADDKASPVTSFPAEDSVCDMSMLKNGAFYSSLDNFLGQTAHVNLDSMQDDYSLAFPEFPGTEFSGFSSVLGDLNNMQTGNFPHDAQGILGDDDSIYVSLGEIPIGFMEDWDQSAQEYGKLF